MKVPPNLPKMCQNTYTKGRPVVQPGCMGSAATRRITITYTPSTDKEILFVCGHCAASIKKDAHKYGYRATVAKL